MDIPSNKNTISIPVKEIGHTLTAEEFNKVVDAITSNKYDIYTDTAYCKSGVYATGNTMLESAQIEDVRVTENLSVFMVDKYNNEDNTTKADLSFETLCTRVVQLKNAISELATQSIDQEAIMNALRPTLNQYLKTSVFDAQMNQIQSRFSSIDAEIADIRANGGGSSGSGSGSGSGSSSSGSSGIPHIDPNTQTDEYNYIKSLDTVKCQKFKIYKPTKEDLDFGAWISGAGKTWSQIAASTDFPSTALVGYTQSSIVIYDISTPSNFKKWCEFNVHKFITGDDNSTALQITCIAVKNGIVVIGVSNSADSYVGVFELNFTKDTIRFFGIKGGFNTMISLDGIGSGYSNKVSNNVSENYNFDNISDINIFVDDMISEDISTGKKYVKYAICDTSKLKIVDQKNYEYKIYNSQTGIHFTSTFYDTLNGRLYATTISDGIYIFTTYDSNDFNYAEYMNARSTGYGIKKILFNSNLQKCIVTDSKFYICYNNGIEIVDRNSNSSFFVGSDYSSGIMYNDFADSMFMRINGLNAESPSFSANYTLQIQTLGSQDPYYSDITGKEIYMSEGTNYDVTLNNANDATKSKFVSVKVTAGSIYADYNAIKNNYMSFWKKDDSIGEWVFTYKLIADLVMATDGIEAQNIVDSTNNISKDRLIIGNGEFAFIKIYGTSSLSTSQQNNIKNYENDILNTGTRIAYFDYNIANYTYEKSYGQFFIALNTNKVIVFKNGEYNKTITFNANDTINWFDWNFGFLGYTTEIDTKILSSKEYVTSSGETLNKTEIVSDLSDYISSVFSPMMKAETLSLLVQYNRGMQRMEGNIRSTNFTEITIPPYSIAVHDKILVSNENKVIQVLQNFDSSEISTYSATNTLAGKDFYIWLSYDNNIFITNSKIDKTSMTNPASFDKEKAVIIGGFHCLCTAIPDNAIEPTHPLKGYGAGDILPQTVWCENNRPICSPLGMFKDINGLPYWYDIYPSSVRNLDVYESVYKQDSPVFLPDTSISTGDPWIEAMMKLAGAGKSMLSSEQWYSAGYGTPEGTGNSALNSTKTGGFVTVGNVRLVSYAGGEGFSGYEWQFLSDSILYSAGMNDSANSDLLPGNKLVHYIGKDYFFFNNSWWKQSMNEAVPTRRENFLQSDVTAIQDQLLYSSDRKASYFIPSKSVLCRMLAGGVSDVNDIQQTNTTVHNVNNIYSRAIIDYQNQIFSMNKIAVRGSCIAKS